MSAANKDRTQYTTLIHEGENVTINPPGFINAGEGGGGDPSDILRQAKAYTDEKTAKALEDAEDYTDEELKQYMPQLYTDEQNSSIYVDEFVGVLRTYYKKRTKTEGGQTVNTFTYGQTATALDSDYFDGSTAIDCSSYIGICLRGIPFDKSPYASLNTEPVPGDSEPVEDITDGDDPQDGSGTGRYMTRNAGYAWSINPGLSLISPTGDKNDTPTPVRNTGQLAEYFVRQGRIIYANPDPLGNPDPDETFENVERGDLVFWSKPRFIDGEGYDDEGGYKNEHRFWHISHIAAVIGKTPATGAVAAAGYPYKHTTFEVSTPGHIVLNRSIEKIARSAGGTYNYPDQQYISLIVRPNFGTISHDETSGSQLTASGITDLNGVYTAGTWYLTSSVTSGLPDGISSGLFYTLNIVQTANKYGEPYSIIQTLTHTKTGRQYVRVQYAYSNDYTPATDRWSDWRQVSVYLGDGYVGSTVTDLDDVTTPGRYILATRVVTNLPFGTSGHTYQTLDVEGTYDISGTAVILKQTFTDARDNRVCVRMIDLGATTPAWTAWKEITMA